MEKIINKTSKQDSENSEQIISSKEETYSYSLEGVSLSFTLRSLNQKESFLKLLKIAADDLKKDMIKANN